MTTIRWVRPKGPVPQFGTRLRIQLEQNVGGRPLHFVGYAEVYGDRAVLKITDSSEAGRVAAELLREGLVDPTYWGAKKPDAATEVKEGTMC
jgi:hypothetical protein